uniref:SH3 domain-containing protein n=1 Tax=Nothobranchius korthausae TaxID=1143690 RepID=A0A1A8H284_9TELE
MQRIYTHSNEHFQVFTTVLAPQGRFRYRAEAEKMVVVHSYRPHWPDELALSPGDIILVLSKHEEERWFGRLQDGQWGYFPSSCVMELSQARLPPKGPGRSWSQRITAKDGERNSGHILQTLRRGSRREGGAGLDVGQASFLVQRPQNSLPQPVTSHHQIHRSPSLLHRILSKCRKKSECQGTTNGAFISD